MVRLALILALVWSCRGAVIDGVVVEDETGYPLEWSQVSLIPLPGTKAPATTVKAGNRGTFHISNAAAGWFVLRTSRDGFAANEVGQMRPGRPGIPFELKADGRNYFQVRMRRMGAVSGTVLDHNNVGVPDWPVQIYTAHKPVRRVAQGETDDRGIFRIGLLEGGSYFVRAAGGVLEDGTGLLPAYFQYGTSAKTAEAVRVRVGETRPDVTIRVVRGRMLEIGGVFTSATAAHLTLITESGRAVIATVNPPAASAPFVVRDLAPGPVELVAEGAQCGSYTAIALDREMAGMRVACGALSTPTIEWNSGRAFPILIRRFDLDQTGPAHAMADRETLVPGRYELMPQTGPEAYVESVQNATGMEGWFSVDLSSSPKVRIAVSMHPASVSGKVSSGGAVAAGAMVYLEKTDSRQMWTVRADTAGGYRFSGLAKGEYRLLSSFDFDPEDRGPMNAAPIFTLHEGDQATQPLEMVLP